MSLLFDALKRVQFGSASRGQRRQASAEPPDALSDTAQGPPPGPDSGLVAARAIFSASAPPKRRLLTLVAGGLTLLALSGGLGFWFYLQIQGPPLVPPQPLGVNPAAMTAALTPSPEQEAPAPTNPPASEMATGDPASVMPPAPAAATDSPAHPAPPATPLPAALPVAAPSGQSPAATAPVAADASPPRPAQAAARQAGQEASAVPPAPSATLPPEPSSASQAAPPARPAAKGVSAKGQTPRTNTARASSTQASRRQRPQSDAAPSQPAAEAATANPTGVHIRLSTADPLQDAYEALTGGRLDEAERQYQEVLAKRPRERDALLGLAVIAHRKHQNERAADLYQQVLREDPGNGTATAALVNLSVQADPLAAESRLKNLLEQKPASAELHHALGRVLARQKRWGEAQQAFFRAHGLEPGSALYAFNLAVALDRLRQPAAALPYYVKAAQLIKPGDSSLDRPLIQRRVGELQNSLFPEPQP